jgi:hypothetical protein
MRRIVSVPVRRAVIRTTDADKDEVLAVLARFRGRIWNDGNERPTPDANVILTLLPEERADEIIAEITGKTATIIATDEATLMRTNGNVERRTLDRLLAEPQPLRLRVAKDGSVPIYFSSSSQFMRTHAAKKKACGPNSTSRRSRSSVIRKPRSSHRRRAGQFLQKSSLSELRSADPG